MADPISAAPAAAPASEAPPVLDNNTPAAPKSPADLAAAAKPAAPKVEAPVSSKRKLKLKVDGQEEDFEFDPSNDEEMTRHFQMSKMSQKRASEAAQLRKQVEDIGNYLAQAKGDKSKLRSLIKELGGDEKEIAAMIIEEEIANSQKSPEQLAKESLEKELKELKDQREREKQEFNKRELERLQNQEMERYDVLVSQAIEKSDLPKSPYVVRKMADYMLLALENGVDLSPNEIIGLVREETYSDLQQMINAMGEDKVEAFIGKDVLTKLRKKNVAKAKAAGTPPPPVKKAGVDVGAKPSEKEAKPGEKKTFKQMFGV